VMVILMNVIITVEDIVTLGEFEEVINLMNDVDEPASPFRDDSQGKACHTDSGFEADQDRANIAKTFTLPSDSTPRVTSLTADEGKVATTIVSIPTGSGVVSTASPTIPTAAPIFTTATESTPYTRRKGTSSMIFTFLAPSFSKLSPFLLNLSPSSLEPMGKKILHLLPDWIKLFFNFFQCRSLEVHGLPPSLTP
nr:hypothetical protein [Tanacetum cinerariifolium]